jgi:hypothetical protein
MSDESDTMSAPGYFIRVEYKGVVRKRYCADAETIKAYLSALVDTCTDDRTMEIDLALNPVFDPFAP